MNKLLIGAIIALSTTCHAIDDDSSQLSAGTYAKIVMKQATISVVDGALKLMRHALTHPVQTVTLGILTYMNPMGMVEALGSSVCDCHCLSPFNDGHHIFIPKKLAAGELYADAYNPLTCIEKCAVVCTITSQGKTSRSVSGSF